MNNEMSVISNNNAVKIKRLVFLSCTMFLFFFEWNIYSFITTRRLAILIAGLYLLLSKRTREKLSFVNFKYHTQYLILLLVPLSFNIINNIWLVKNAAYEYFEPIHFLNLFLYIVVFSMFIIVYVDSPKEFCWAFIIIILIQSVFVYNALINYSFRMWLYKNFYNGDNRFDRYVENGSRIMGLALNSSLGSITMLCSLVSLYYLYRRKLIGDAIFLVFYAFILGATAFIARTGFYIGLALLIPYFVSAKSIIKKIIFAIIICIFLYFVFFNYLSQWVDSGQWNYFMRWIGEIFNSETRYNTIDAIRTDYIPPLSFEMFFGTGLLRGVTNGGVQLTNDSGYVEIYTSLGLLGAIFFYGSFFLMFKSILKKIVTDKSFFIMLFAIMLIIEWKEPYIRKYVYTTFLLSIMLLHAYSDCNLNTSDD